MPAGDFYPYPFAFPWWYYQPPTAPTWTVTTIKYPQPAPEGVYLLGCNEAFAGQPEPEGTVGNNE